MEKFSEPVLVTRPLTPDLVKVAKRLEGIWDSGHLTNHGPQHEQLQEKLRHYLQAPQVELFNNGTMALLLGLKALDLTGEVITTPFTFPATVEALDWNGLTPVFCDIQSDTLNINPDKIESLITGKTSAILAVHVFGNPCEVEKIQLIADKYGLKVIYDAAHAFGSTVRGKPVAQFGDMTMFSFHATKLFNTVEGGALAVNDKALSEKLRLLRNFGLETPEKVVLSGLNGKMNEIQAAIGLEVLPAVEAERNKRDFIKQLYETGLSGIPGIRIITHREQAESSYQYFVIEINEARFGRSRDWVQEQLKKQNIWARKYFYPLCSEFEWYGELESAKEEALPNAHRAVEQVLALPYYGEIEKETVEFICRFFKEIHVGAAATN